MITNEQFFNNLPDAFKTDDVKKWFNLVKENEDVKIRNGLILEFDDLFKHPFDESIWIRFIDSLSFLLRSESYYTDVLASINIIQQLNIKITNHIDAPMAISLVDIDTMLSNDNDIKIDYKKKPYLYINPVTIWSVFIDINEGIINDKIKNDMFRMIVYMLVHETYHHLAGHLLQETKHHYTSPKKDKEYEAALKSEPFKINLDGNENEIRDIHELLNILQDASINADILEQNPQAFPEKLQSKSISPLSMTDTFIDLLKQAKEYQKTNTQFYEPIHYNIQSADDFFNDKTAVRNKQYAILEILKAKSENNDDDNDSGDNNESNDSDDSSSENGEGNGSGNSNNQNNDSNNNDSGKLSDGDIKRKNENALSNNSKDDLDNIATRMNNIVNVANSNAQSESNGRAKSVEISGDLEERIIEIQKAKKLPRLDKKVKSLIDDLNNKKRLNWNRRHIAYPTRLDMAYHEKIPTPQGFYAYLDVSGSVTNELLQNLFSILYENSKEEPCYLYVFATTMSEKPLQITKRSTIDDILKYINDENVGFTTNFENVFKDIVKTKEYKHAIFSDYMFNILEYTNYRKEIIDSIIIHVAEDINMMQSIVPALYKDILKHRQNHKLIQQSDYIEIRKEVVNNGY